MNEEDFHNNIDKWLEADVSEWTHITLLAHFCKKYKQKNGVKFRLVRAVRGPTMGKEASDFAKLFRTLAPENYKELAKDKKDSVRHEINLKIFNYVNWMFDYKFRSGMKSVNGTRLFLVPSIIVEFERMYDVYLAKKQSESNISKLISWCNKEIPEIFASHQLTMEGDIAMIKKYAEMYGLAQDSAEQIVLNKASELGLL